jgi:23S rRNA (uracil1939-C5)-methyltransferase
LLLYGSLDASLHRIHESCAQDLQPALEISVSRLTLEDVLSSDTLKIEIDDFGYTGEGFVRLADGWMSVPGALPGERVRVAPEHPEHLQGRRVFARVLEVLKPSDDRRPPLCDRDDVCRGCQLRHMTVERELAFKRRTISEVVEKFGGVDPEEQPPIERVTPRPIQRGDAHRIRSRLSYKPDGADGEPNLGLISPIRSAPVSMSSCPALTEPARRLVGYVETSLSDALDEASDEHRDFSGLDTIDVASPVFGRGLITVSISETERRAEDAGIEGWLDDLAERVPEDVGIAVEADGLSCWSGPEQMILPIAGKRITVTHHDWFPATIAPTEAVYDTTLDWLNTGEAEAYLDIGCGVGTLSIMIGPHVERATGIDRNHHTVESAEFNAVRHELDHLEFRASHWEKALRTLAMEEASFDIATINPMREPLGKRALSYVKRLDIRQLVYLGPSPESASKDLNALVDSGWHLDRLAAGNVHPASYHTMLMARLTRR